ncbi:MAG: type III pantothenate kinase [Thiohalocapsa sp.]|jgi:type III pantothenate kinase|uniref:type III pantothenate kinase n=1 Tax=Thiohalocapsa sp. TaxID=2497641 RepID=UPI0025DA6865|nr:type III pantothenate kinase [Thiohalocapsa sp.]MCG6941522.1 type III pantothenate kinase [Thiohalocapsa sp.]
MQLLVDIGNTSIKWALRHPDDAELNDYGAAMHGGALPLDLLAVWDELDGIDAVIAAGVGPREVKDAVGRVCDACWGCEPKWVETRSEACGVRIAYPEPARLGVDRFLALIAVHQWLAAEQGDPAPALIVDAGTAITYDLLQADGQHLGGLILPGIRIMRDSLLAGTQIPRYEPAEADLAWAADTGEAIAAASIQAPAALIERLGRRLQQHGGTEPQLILSGGDAERLAAAIDLPATHIPDLVLRGLAAFG